MENMVEDTEYVPHLILKLGVVDHLCWGRQSCRDVANDRLGQTKVLSEESKSGDRIWLVDGVNSDEPEEGNRGGLAMFNSRNFFSSRVSDPILLMSSQTRYL